MEGSIEQMYPRSKGDYEKYVDKLFSLISKHTFEKDKKQGGAQSVVILGAMLDQCLNEASPEEIKELNRCVGEVINKKIEQHNRELGKVKSKLKGAKLFEDGAADFSKLEEKIEGNEEKVTEEEKLRMDKEQEEREKRDRLAQADLKRKEGERVELQKAMKKEERKVDSSHFAGMQMMKKDDDDMFFGGGKKKGKKK
ncbi:hypothetical protein DIPPA_30937 [Diplonema papillatum]|nr:hypothetical protein DIPPA_30937 [Diplonema papillatum]|eukprot:gene14067-21530_t